MKSDIIAKYGFKQVLKDEANKLDIELSNKMLEMFELYKDLLIEWNKKINLTAITDEYEIILKHFVDCLEIVKYLKENESVIDVGTGAGFPGIVIAIYFQNQINITLFDSLNKRLIFLEEIKNKLGLENIEIIHGRAEESGNDTKFREQYDIAVSRAVANLNVLLEFDTPFIKVGGRCLLMKGENAQIEIENAKNSLAILNTKITNNYTYSYLIEDEVFNRSIIEITKIKNTPKRFPRSYGKIKKEPLA